jgi:hypothetical protein
MYDWTLHKTSEFIVSLPISLDFDLKGNKRYQSHIEGDVEDSNNVREEQRSACGGRRVRQVQAADAMAHIRVPNSTPWL